MKGGRFNKKRSKTRRRRRRKRKQKTRMRRKSRRRKYRRTRVRRGGNGIDYAAAAASALAAQPTNPIDTFEALYTRLSKKVSRPELWKMAYNSLAKGHLPVLKICSWLMIRNYLPQKLQDIPDLVRKLFVLKIIPDPKQLMPRIFVFILHQ